MIWVGVVFCIFVLIFFVIYFTTLTILIRVHKSDKRNEAIFIFKCWNGLIRYEIKIPFLKIDDDGPNVVFEEDKKSGNNPKKEKKETKKVTPEEVTDSFSDMKTLLEHIKAMHKIVASFMSTIKISNFKWETMFATGDAAKTGMATGLVWTTKSTFISVLSSFFRLMNRPLIHVQPVFQGKGLESRLSCMVQFRIGNAIKAGFKMIRYWRGGKAKFKTLPLSKLSSTKKNETMN